MADLVDGGARTLLATLDPLRHNFEDTPMETIRADAHSHLAGDARSAIRTEPPGEESSLELEQLLGEGGMGTVHLATQRSIGRQVAVKRIRESEFDALTERALLCEGWIMAALEHPNIPPVHDIVLAPTGLPMIVLKRIEGDDWDKLMFDKAESGPRSEESLLDRNLEILDKVCDAISFAHSKGIVHRDLKPSNIMVGAFGEVYVLDWGIAVGLEKDGSGRIPFVGDSPQPIGTPVYMAPELLDGDPMDVGRHTDIYLLGGILYEIISGNPPHLAQNMAGVIRSISKSQPAVSELPPSELIEICQKAMQLQPSNRFRSVEEFQQALRLFQQHRSTQLLLDDAKRRLDEFRGALKQAEASENSAELTPQYRETCFAYRQILLLAPEDPDATAGLRQAIESMTRATLADGRLEAARALLKELSEPDPKLLEELERRETVQRAELEAEQARIDSLVAAKLDKDVSIGQRARGLLLLAVGAGWFASVCTLGFLQRGNVITVTNVMMAAAEVLMLSGLGLALLFNGKALLRNQASRSVMVGLLACMLGCLFLFIVGALFELPVSLTLALGHIVMWTAVLVSTPYDRRFASGVVLLPLGVVIAWVPAYALEINGAVVLLTLSGFYVSMRGTTATHSAAS